MKRKTRRLYFLIAGALAVAAGAGLMLTAFEEAIVFFYSPSELLTRTPASDQRLRLGGLVADGSVKKKGELVTFAVTDLENTISVSYLGILPDLFREGQGVIAEGQLAPDGHFVAFEVLAKHDENYMPPEVAEAIKASGQWKPIDNAKTAQESLGVKP